MHVSGGEPQGTRLSGQLLIPVTPPPSFSLELDKQTSLSKEDEAKGWGLQP